MTGQQARNQPLQHKGHSRANLMQCDQCTGQLVAIPNRESYQCDSCRHYVFTTPLDDPAEPIELTGDPVGVLCPKCQCQLEFAILHGHWRVCYCTTCRGYAIDNGCLGVIIHELRSRYRGQDDQPVPLNPSELEEHRCCPACHQWMETYPYYGPGTAVINSCAGCKVTWMDHRELASIVRAPGFRHPANSSPIAVKLDPHPKELEDRTFDAAGRIIVQAATGFLF
jgi:Zn-finger nucleic acid-binding protein